MEDIQLINGSWVQTIAYMLLGLDTNISGKLDEQIAAINQYSGLTECTSGATNITIEEYFQNIPPKYVINVTDEPLCHIRGDINVRLQRRQLPQQIINIDITRKAAYNRICGASSGSDSRLVNCFSCVDKWLASHPNYELKDFTSSKIGCNSIRRSCP